MIRDSRRHPPRDSDAGMYAAQIVVREVQRDSRFQVRQLLAESIRQSRKSAKVHSHRQILSLNLGHYPVARLLALCICKLISSGA